MFLNPDKRATGRRKGPLRTRLGSFRTRLADRLERLFEIKAIWSALFLLTLTPLLMVPRIGPALPRLEAGSVAPEDVIAPVSLEFADDAATEEVRSAARDLTPPVYNFDSLARSEAISAVRRTFALGRQALEDVAAAGAEPAFVRSEVLRALRQNEEIPASPEALEYLVLKGFDPEIEERLVAALRAPFLHRIVGSKTFLPRSGRVTLRDTRSGREWREEDLKGVLSLDEARQVARETLRSAGAGRREEAAVAPLLTELIAPNLIFNRALTDDRRQEAADRIEPLIVRVPKGKVILRRGEVVSEDKARVLEAFHEARREGSSAGAILGNLLFMALLLFFLSRYVFFYQKSYRRERHLFALMVLVMVIGLLMDRGFAWLYQNVVDTLQAMPFADPSFYRFMVPMAAGSMLVTLLANPRVGMAFALFYVPLFGMMMEWDLALMLYCLVSNLAAIYGISAYHQRTALIRAGLFLGGVNAVTVLALESLPALESVAGRTPPVTHLLYQMFCGFVGGILVAVLVSFLLPVLEWFFNILTDVRLLELSNLNNPLLRRLAVEAPGSYNHSVIVGTLAEAAAEAIGANALFCRVAAYYHDVGKMLKPDYFVENQREGLNRHDGLSPHMSALVIASHVKDGYELARSYGLPKQVLDIIPQHHGTRRINYFYEKAKRSENPSVEEVRESDYRYPGPKPQSKEAAIFMLSDSIEAAARTLDDPSPARFKGLIRRIVSDVVLDDQFDQCDLTFSELDKVQAAFMKTLSSIYHHRIDYPGFDFEKVSARSFQGSRTHEAPPARVREWGR
ncbi:MAG: HD family phosphohydrolase [Acidobacteriota bacterium]